MSSTRSIVIVDDLSRYGTDLSAHQFSPTVVSEILSTVQAAHSSNTKYAVTDSEPATYVSPNATYREL